MSMTMTNTMNYETDTEIEEQYDYCFNCNEMCNVDDMEEIEGHLYGSCCYVYCAECNEEAICPHNNEYISSSGESICETCSASENETTEDEGYESQ